MLVITQLSSFRGSFTHRRACVQVAQLHYTKVLIVSTFTSPGKLIQGHDFNFSIQRCSADISSYRSITNSLLGGRPSKRIICATLALTNAFIHNFSTRNARAMLSHTGLATQTNITSRTWLVTMIINTLHSRTWRAHNIHNNIIVTINIIIIARGSYTHVIIKCTISF